MSSTEYIREGLREFKEEVLDNPLMRIFLTHVTLSIPVLIMWGYEAWYTLLVLSLILRVVLWIIKSDYENWVIEREGQQ